MKCPNKILNDCRIAHLSLDLHIPSRSVSLKANRVLLVVSYSVSLSFPFSPSSYNGLFVHRIPTLGRFLDSIVQRNVFRKTSWKFLLRFSGTEWKDMVFGKFL